MTLNEIGLQLLLNKFKLDELKARSTTLNNEIYKLVGNRTKIVIPYPEYKKAIMILNDGKGHIQTIFCDIAE